jgi:hypothetical protein
LIRQFFQWLKLKRLGPTLTVQIDVTGAENDPCQYAGCGVRRKFHSFAVEKHHFVEEESTR